MNLKVAKFGGSSLTCEEDFRRIAQSLVSQEEEIVVVVSARGGSTDGLIKQMNELAEEPPVDALDALLTTGEQQSAALMAAAITEAGRPAEVVPPWLIFETDGAFGDGEIRRVDVRPIRERLDRSVICVVGGFTGRAPDGRLCTLGRGGSDYSAVAIGAALRVEVELHKADTDGIYTVDPNENPAAERFDVLTHEEAFSLAAEGAKVLHDKAAQLALEKLVPIWVRSTFGNGEGTRIVATKPELATA